MALVSYSNASSGSSDSDSEGTDRDSGIFLFPLESSSNPMPFSKSIGHTSKQILPHLEEEKITPDKNPPSRPNATPPISYPEFHGGSDRPTADIGPQVPDGTNSTGLSSADLYKLCGSRAKRFSASEIDLIEIDGSSFVNNRPDIRFNDPAVEREFSNKKFKSSRVEKSKHQITFLAEHAKLHEREINLIRSNWFHNKRKTQGRYGF